MSVARTGPLVTADGYVPDSLWVSVPAEALPAAVAEEEVVADLCELPQAAVLSAARKTARHMCLR